MRPGLFAIAVLLTPMLAACASLSQDQCQAGDWRAIGMEDGRQGRPLSRLSNHTEACSEYGIAVDQALYLDGREQGLLSYCRPEVAARESVDGRRYYNVCEGAAGQSFARVYAAGERIYQLEAELNSIGSEIDSVSRQLRQSGLSESEVASLLREIRFLERDRNSLRRDIRLAESRLSAITAQEQARLAALGV